jgi:hypothetical protein
MISERKLEVSLDFLSRRNELSDEMDADQSMAPLLPAVDSGDHLVVDVGGPFQLCSKEESERVLQIRACPTHLSKSLVRSGEK